MNRLNFRYFAAAAGLLAALTLSAQEERTMTQDDLLRRIDQFGQPPGQKPANSKPLSLEGTPLAPKKTKAKPAKPRGTTEITSKELTFDQRTRQAVFIGDVVVRDPEFNVDCDRLTALLKKEKGSSDSSGANPSPAAAAEKNDKGGGLERAIAEANTGNVVVVTQDKIESDGSISKSVGKAKRVTYDAATGDVVLTGMPSIQQGINLCVATGDSTVMTLNREGRMHVEGPSKSVINDTAGLDPSR